MTDEELKSAVERLFERPGERIALSYIRQETIAELQRPAQAAVGSAYAAGYEAGRLDAFEAGKNSARLAVNAALDEL